MTVRVRCPPAMRRPTTVTEVRPDDWTLWRDLRLAALQDSPHAFASTYEGERGRDEAQWRARIAADGVLMVGSVDGVPAGTVGAYHPRPGVVELISMWVAPAARGHGLGDALVRALIDWSRADGADELELWVVVGNEPAERLYARHGFTRTGYVQPLPQNPAVDEFTMRLPLAGDTAVDDDAGGRVSA